MPACILPSHADNRYGLLRKYRRCMEKRTMMLAAVQAVTNPDAIRATCRDELYVAAEATAGVSILVGHAAPCDGARRSAMKMVAEEGLEPPTRGL